MVYFTVDISAKNNNQTGLLVCGIVFRSAWFAHPTYVRMYIYIYINIYRLVPSNRHMYSIQAVKRSHRGERGPWIGLAIRALAKFSENQKMFSNTIRSAHVPYSHFPPFSSVHWFAEWVASSFTSHLFHLHLFSFFLFFFFQISFFFFVRFFFSHISSVPCYSFFPSTSLSGQIKCIKSSIFNLKRDTWLRKHPLLLFLSYIYIHKMYVRTHINFCANAFAFSC